MSAAFMRSNVVRKIASVVCLLALPAAAQQANVQPVAAQASLAGADELGGKQPAASLPNAPQPQKLPQVDYSKPAPLFPNPFARYAPREVPPAVTVNSPRVRDLVQNGKIMLSLN